MKIQLLLLALTGIFFAGSARSQDSTELLLRETLLQKIKEYRGLLPQKSGNDTLSTGFYTHRFRPVMPVQKSLGNAAPTMPVARPDSTFRSNMPVQPMWGNAYNNLRLVDVLPYRLPNLPGGNPAPATPPSRQ